MNKVALTSTNYNPDYFFFLPIVGVFWNRMGFKHHSILIGSEKKWCDPLIDIVINYSRATTDITYLDPTELKKRYAIDMPEWALAPISRLLGGGIPNLFNNEVVLTADIDMLPLKADHFDVIERKTGIHLFGEEAESGGYGLTRFPLCYISADTQTWTAINNGYSEIYRGMKNLINRFGIDSKDANWQRQCDEQIFHALLHEYLKAVPQADVYFHPRKMVPNHGYRPGMNGVPGILPVGRLDRSNWIYDSNNRNDYIDAHCKRGAWQEGKWQELVELFNDFLRPTEVDLLQQYRKDFVNALDS